MRFEELTVEGAYVLDFDWIEDQRGAYGRGWQKSEFASRGLAAEFSQTNLVYTRSRGTLRGLHWQVAPCQQAKLLICTRGSVFEVIVDVRKESATFMKSVMVELSAGNPRMVYVPEGCAHGFLTLEGHSEVLYSSTTAYDPASERGVRYDDPAFAVQWPIEVKTVSLKDLSWPRFESDDLMP